MIRSFLHACADDAVIAAKLLGVRPRTIARWLAGEIGINASSYEVLRLMLWLDREGLRLPAVARRDASALEALRETARDGDEPDEATLAALEDGEP